MRRYKVLVEALLALGFLVAPTRAQLITSVQATVLPDNGLYGYRYVLTNDSVSTLNAIAFGVAVDTSADLSTITCPLGWLPLYNFGDTDISWQSPDAAYDLLPGSSYTFSFLSALPPGSNTYTVLGIDPNSSDFDFNSGVTSSPAPASVPEPGTLELSLVIAGCFGLRWLWVHRKSTTPASSG